MTHSVKPAPNEPPAPPVPLPADDQPLPLESIRAWIQVVDRGLDAVQLQPVEPGAVQMLPAACRRRTHLIDTLIAALYQRARRRHRLSDQACAVFALGSYGRGELCPFSDIDLLVLHDGAVAAEDLNRWLPDFVAPLWDLGLKASQVVYAPEDAAKSLTRLNALAPGDPQAAALQKQITSLLEARLLDATDQPAAAAAIRAFGDLRHDWLRRHGFSFAEHKAQEIAERASHLHIRPWELPTPCYLEPNLKDGPGGLRDAQAAQWIDRALAAGERSAPATEPGAVDPARRRRAHAQAQVLAARVLLHRAAGRAQDRLMQGLQPEVLDRLLAQFQPEALSEEAAERLHRGFQPVYAALTELHGFAGEQCRRIAAGPRSPRRPAGRQRLDRETLDTHWTRVGGELHPSAAGERALHSAQALTVALQGIELALPGDLRLGAVWLDRFKQQLAARAASADPDPDALATFRRLLSRTEPLYPCLLPLHLAGGLCALLPEFNDITGRSQRAPLHEVTVDIHTLRVLGALEHWYLSPREEDRERVALLRGLKRLDLLRWCALLHDIGKSRGDAGHPERGSLMAHDILTRLAYPGEDIRLVRVLIEEHLALFNLTTLDSDDRGPIERLAGRLETRANADLLYLLTIADAQGVAVGALPLWREDRLRAQWQLLRAVLEPAGRRAAITSATQAPAELRQTLLTGLAAHPTRADRRLRTQLAKHLQAMPMRYLTRVSTAAALAHLKLILRLGRAHAVVERVPPPGSDTARSRAAGRPARPGSARSPRRAASERRRAAQAAHGPAPVPIGELWVVTRDRPGRFSQICAGLTGAGLSVISAEVYERADGLILDLFRVMPIPELTAGVAPAELLPHFQRMLEHADELLIKILHHPAAASEVMARMLGHPLLGAHRPTDRAQAEATVHLANASHEPLTIVDVRCPDRAGLLYGLTRAIADLGLNIHFATIDTVRGMATDVFYLSETDGRNLRDAERRRNLRLLLKAVAETPPTAS